MCDNNYSIHFYIFIVDFRRFPRSSDGERDINGILWLLFLLFLIHYFNFIKILGRASCISEKV